MKQDKIVLFLDVDGVLNQYRRSERIRRHKIDYDFCFAPFKKKVKRLAKLVKRYDLDVHVFSAWREKDLQPHLPFKLCGDTLKWVENVHEVSKEYKHSILIDDEVTHYRKAGKDNEMLNDNIITYQPHYLYGLVLKDFQKLDKIIKKAINGTI